MRHTLTLIAATLAFVLAALLGASPTRAQSGTTAVIYTVNLPYIAGGTEPETATNPTEADQVLALVNAERASAGCQPLSLNQKLTDAAQGHSEDMALNNFFSHTGSDGSSASQRVTRAGYSWSTTGENIAAGYASPAEVMQGWMNSPGHRANILNCNFTEIGIGYVYEAGDTFPGPYGYSHYWSQSFGRP